jgi:hypothetical protein
MKNMVVDTPHSLGPETEGKKVQIQSKNTFALQLYYSAN